MSFVLDRVIVFVRDARACAAFYRDHFGLKPVGEWSADWAELDGGGGCGLAFHQAFVDGRPVTQPTGSPMNPHKIVFRVADVRTARAALVAKGVAMGDVLEIPETSGLLLCNGTDLEGHPFQLCNR